jgi:hypothetical protein
VSASGSESLHLGERNGWSFLKRVLFEWLRDRSKEQAHAEIASLEEIENCMVNLSIFQRLFPDISLRALATSSRGLKKDYA